MTVRFSSEVEKERRVKRLEENTKTSWEIFRSDSLVRALHKARDIGWGDKKVQVRMESQQDDIVEYVIEPWEADCSCPNILRFDDYFLRPDEVTNGD